MNDDLKKYNPNTSKGKEKNYKQNTNDETVIYDKKSVLSGIKKADNKVTNTQDKQANNSTSQEIERQRLKQKSKKNTYLFRSIWIVMIVLVSVMIIKYILVGINDMLAINRESSESKVVVEIPKGSGVNEISNILYTSGIIKDKSFFKLYAVLTKSAKKFTQGTYEMKPGMDYEAIVNYLQTQSNRTDTLNLTFTEGKTILEYAQILSENEICDYDEFLSVCNSDIFDNEYKFLSDINNASERYYKLEGYLFPDTYTFYKGEDPKNTVTRFLDNFYNKVYVKKNVEGYSSKINIAELAEEKGMSLNDLTILASLIQAEAADVEDMYYISSIFHNRLSTLNNDGLNEFGEFGMNKLGSDVTVWYPYKNKNDVPADKLNEFPGKYDTYNNAGLPKGPVCSPGLDAIDAALNPKDTDYYYFCHSNDGDSYYAKTNSAHQNNLAKAGLK